MLHTKFQGHWPFDSGEKDFLMFLPYMGMVAILVMLPGPFDVLRVWTTDGQMTHDGGLPILEAHQ